MNDQSAFITRATTAYARLITKHPARVLAVLLTLGVISGYLTSTLTIESDQLSLISQDLPEVKAVRRVVDMVGGAGYLQLALRADDVPTLKKLSDEMYTKLLDAKQPDGTPWVRFITYKVPVDFIQENMVLFIRTEDLAEGKKRINAYIKDQLRRNNPFFIEIKKTEPVKLEMDDLVQKYSSVGKKSIRDDYYISDDKKMLMMLIKPMWNSTDLQKTEKFVEYLTGRKYSAIPPQSRRPTASSETSPKARASSSSKTTRRWATRRPSILASRARTRLASTTVMPFSSRSTRSHCFRSRASPSSPCSSSASGSQPCWC